MKKVIITEDYVSYEVAKLLKEKGFDEPCRTSYSLESKKLNEEEASLDWSTKWYPIVISAPTHQTALKWLREEKHYYIQIMLDSWALGGHLGYYIVIQDINSDFEECSPHVNDENTVFFKTYEEAIEAALKYVLENLI